MSKLMIGWSEADITPPENKRIPLYGQYYERIATEIHSRLKTVAAAFSSECGTEQFLLASIDNVGVQEQMHALVREQVARLEPQINPAQVFINAIHTHSAPSLRVVQKSVMYAENAAPDVLSSDEYLNFAVPIIAENIVKAWRARKVGGIARGFGNARVGHCRRAVYSNGRAEMYGDTTRRDFIGIEAGEDSGVDLLFTYDADSKPTGVLLNVACPSQVMESTYKLSSDFAGATRELLKKDFGADFSTLYMISAAGCQSPRDLVRHYTTEPDFWHDDGVAEIAERLRKAVHAADKSEIDFEPIFKANAARISLPRRRASYEDFIAAKKELAELEAVMPEAPAFEEFCRETHENEKVGGPGPYDSKLHHFVKIKNAQAIIKRYGEQDSVPNVEFDMGSVRIGDAAIATNPFELYLYYGQIIKARSPAAQTFLVQLCAGASISAGYLPSPDAEKFGGYGGCIINGQCGHDAGYKLADETVGALEKLFAK